MRGVAHLAGPILSLESGSVCATATYHPGLTLTIRGSGDAADRPEAQPRECRVRIVDPLIAHHEPTFRESTRAVGSGALGRQRELAGVPSQMAGTLEAFESTHPPYIGVLVGSHHRSRRMVGEITGAQARERTTGARGICSEVLPCFVNVLP